MNRILAAVTCGALLAACAQLAGRDAPKSGIDLANRDRSVRPQDDFFRYVNGTWLKSTQIPADKPMWAPYIELRDTSDAQVRAIIEEASKLQNVPGSEAQKVGDYYASFMDEERVESLGSSPVAAARWLCAASHATVQ